MSIYRIMATVQEPKSTAGAMILLLFFTTINIGLIIRLRTTSKSGKQEVHNEDKKALNFYLLCGAYSTAAIIRYYLNNPSTPTALDLMTLISAGSNPDQTFSLSNSMIIGWNYFGVNFMYVDGTINAIAQIDNNKPVYVYGYDYTNENAHAFVIRGYNISGNVYSVWNPWHSYYESMNMSTLTFAANSSQIYTWTQTLYIGNSL